ncbi:CoA-binding protein [Dokdonia sp. Dokd-P16]|uniref:CoA-binding protein n=1 Tax=Dokdonia sp. Dokd-P16 TaxID=2173169 RepID=UPI0019514F8A|nr:CoA-binding protein [Dokdonia sp. Dokd-P16]
MIKATMVIGASLKPQRYSHSAIIRLDALDIPVIAVGLREGRVGTTDIITFDTAVAQLETLKENLNTITLYLNPQCQEEYYDFIIDLNPRRVIFNPGTDNPLFAAKLQSKGILTESACTLVMLATGQY